MTQGDISGKMTKSFLLALILLGIFSVISYLTFYNSVKTFQSDSLIINLGGQQRSLSQQIALLSGNLIREKNGFRVDSLKKELISLIQKMESDHHFLVHNKETSGHFRSEKIMDFYYAGPHHLDQKIHEYLETAKCIYREAKPEEVALLSEKASPLLQKLNLIYQEESEMNIAGYQWQKLLFLFSLIALMFLIWKIIFRPAYNELNQYIDKLVLKENDLLEANLNLEKMVEARAEEIRKSENSYKTLVEKMNEGVAHYTLDGTFTFVNDKYCQILGYDREELIGQPIFKIFFNDDVEKIRQKIQQRKVGISENYELVLPRKNGKEIWLHVNSSTITEENLPTGVMVVISDITEEKETQKSLAELNKFNETLLQTIPLGMQVVNAEGTILYANKVMKELAGFDPTGNKCWSIIHDDKAPCETCLRGLGIEHGKINVCELQKVFNGKTVHIFQSGINYSHTRAVLEIYIDITALKETERKLMDKNRELQTFIFRASHDMRSPIANILGLLNLLKKNSSENEQIIDKLRESTLNMDGIILELISIGQAYNNQLNINSVKTDELFREVQMEAVEKNKIYDLQFSFKNNYGDFMHTDKILLKSILKNIIDNSIRYRECKRETTVFIRIDKNKNGARIEISDNGQGMETEVQERAFDMFYRGNLASRGTGLGLYMVKMFVEKLQGEIRLNSRKNVGTTITLTLPDLLAGPHPGAVT